MEANTANTILTQLGGNKFIAMTGAKSLILGQRSLTFSLPTNISRGNRMTITLDANDLYKVEVLRYRNLELKSLAVRDMVGAESLGDVFTSLTGLETRL